jgi:hypothetical protein
VQGFFCRTDLLRNVIHCQNAVTQQGLGNKQALII